MKNKLFDTEYDDLQFKKENFLTVGKLKEYLNNFPDDMLIYSLEPNTGTWQNIPDINYIIRDYSEELKMTKEWLEKWYSKRIDPEKTVKQELDNMFRYVSDKNALYIQN